MICSTQEWREQMLIFFIEIDIMLQMMIEVYVVDNQKLFY